MRLVRLLLAVAFGAAATAAAAGGSPSAASQFVTRSGTTLVLDGRPFRFGGANIEWLGVAGYGPADPAGPHLPSHHEIDDALDTAKALGATVVRSQTMGDSVGCDVCLEPSPGVFDDAAFERVDYALAAARKRGIRVIPTIIGDDARDGGSGCVYLHWRGIDVPDCSLVNMEPFWTNTQVLADVELHIKVLLDHVNVYTHVAYKNDPTILGWDLMNGGGSNTPWTRTIARYVRKIDTHHLILSAYQNAKLGAVGACVGFVYAHWSLGYDVAKPWIDACKRAGKPFIAYEYGWDRTNLPTQAALRSFLATLRSTPNIAGDAFWALQAHADGHGWLPIPADTHDPAVAETGESGEWWALYWPGIETLVNSAADMTARAEIIRAHNFAMRGLRPPPLTPPPAATAVVARRTAAGVEIEWQGSVGAARYSIERAARASGPWRVVCNRCATDVGGGFVDASPPAAAWYRVVPFNVAGRRGKASAAATAS